MWSIPCTLSPLAQPPPRPAGSRAPSQSGTGAAHWSEEAAAAGNIGAAASLSAPGHRLGAAGPAGLGQGQAPPPAGGAAVGLTAARPPDCLLLLSYLEGTRALATGGAAFKDISDSLAAGGQGLKVAEATLAAGLVAERLMAQVRGGNGLVVHVHGQVLGLRRRGKGGGGEVGGSVAGLVSPPLCAGLLASTCPGGTPPLPGLHQCNWNVLPPHCPCSP